MGTLLTWVGAIGAVAATVFGALAWRDARPLSAFDVSGLAGRVFRLQRTGHRAVVIERAWIPHWAQLDQADDSGHQGPWTLRRGQSVFLVVPDEAQPGIDIAIEWRFKRGPGSKKSNFWTLNLLG